MKKLLMVAIAAFGLMSIVSCNGTTPNDDGTKPATCQIINNATPAISTSGADGTMYETSVMFYNDETVELGVLSIGNVASAGGQSAELEANVYATKVRLSFKLSPTSGVEYTVDYFSLTAQTLTVISITDDTMLTTTKGETKGETITLREALSKL